MATLSNIRTDNFLYSQINKIITPEENNFLYGVAIRNIELNKSDYEEGSYFILDEDLPKYKENGIQWCKDNYILQSNAPIKTYERESDVDKLNYICEKIQERLINIFDKYNDYFPRLYKEFEYFENIDVNSFKKLTERKVSCNVNITCFDESCELKPHTDWIEELRIDNGVDSLKELNAGRYKGVIYLGDENLKYDGYGTRTYINTGSDTDFKEIEEIPYVIGNGILFRSEKYSYHGTDFPKDSKLPRITLCFEYY